MDKRHELFQHFVEANELSDMMDFRAKQRRYSGLGHHAITIEQFMGTVEFCGFTDGYEGRAHRYRNPKGTADDGLKGQEPEIIGELAKCGIEIDGRYRQTGPGSASAQYDAQYVLGQSLKGGF